MGVFIFQSVPERYDLRHAIVPEKRDTWYATRYRGEMQPGNPVLFWMAGAESHRGLYGWGTIASEPYMKPEWDSHGVDVVYKIKFSRLIPALAIRAVPELSKMLIFRAPAATNFLLSEEEAVCLIKLIDQLGEESPPWEV